MSGASGGARITDLRYSRDDGARGGTGASVLALARWGAFGALGARRGWKAKFLPIALTLFALGPAVVLLGLRAFLPDDFDDLDLVSFSDYQRQTGAAILLFAAVIAPELLCPDRRDGVLSLYYSTALSPRQYLAGKTIAAVVPLLLVTLVPMLFLFVGLVLFDADPLDAFISQLDDLPRIVGAGLASALYFGLLGLAIASLTPRRAFAAGGYLAVLIASTAVAGALRASGAPEVANLLALPGIPTELGARLFPGYESASSLGLGAYALGWAVVVGASCAILLRRYRAQDL